ncbi:hypothetical protein [Nonlabens marinus]|uniref:Uncharacterized protein n=1 Tax=Nonlabens marinus S1-08 TaxID=1454201 RepID=W8VWC7_9FLAO|nr:hypothetical protein [Nonlabens marinus]BAO54657.1 hypothetical protein NMS_0648 [Nonlabens marinus S1-08]
MRNLKHISIALALVVSCGMSAQLFQEGKTSTGTQLDLQTFQNSELTTMQLTEPGEVDGDPLLFDKYMPAEIIFVGTDQKPINMYLNYNVYANLMKMLSDEENKDEVRMLPRASNFDILIDNKRFRYIDFKVDGSYIESYVEILDSYENGDLLVLHRTKEIQKAVSNGSSYALTTNDRYKSDDAFYYIKSDGTAIEMENHKRRITNNLSSKAEDMVKDYIKEKNVKFEDDLKGLKGVARYYNSI